MCGICGDIRTPQGGLADEGLLAAMNTAQRHRGPDDTGLWVHGPVGLGHQRLSILDLSGGHQPMADPSGELILTYNGEIYNYVELRERLQAHGHRFRTTGDTEVLLQAYLEWGVEMLGRLNGMFAFALYDLRRGWLFAARDPVGQKPFLYYVDGCGLVFSSELSALLQHPHVPRDLDHDAIARYLVYENFAAPDTPLQGVRKLSPGHALLYVPQTQELRLWRYWDPVGEGAPTAERPLTIDDEEEFAEQLRDAVARHLRSDVPVGVYLSGGVDSTALAVLACDLMGGRNLQTFTLGYSERSFDESAQARRLAQQLGTVHHERSVTAAQSVQAIPEAVAHLDEPLADPGYLSTCQVAALAAQYVKVVLSGDGGDELLCGYDTFKIWEMSEWLYQHSAPWVHQGLRRAITMLPAQYGYMGVRQRARHFVRGLDAPSPIRNTLWISAFMPSEAADVLRRGHDLWSLRPQADGMPPVFERVQAIHRHAGAFDGVGRLAMEYQQTYLSDCICAHTDKANMRVSLEARSPFLDTAVMRDVNVLPFHWKLNGWTTKRILRRWLRRRLGWALPLKKHGFAVPLSVWLRRDLRRFAEELLNREALEAVGVFEPSVVGRIWREHQDGRANHAKKLWTLIVFQAWYLHRIAGHQPRGLALRRAWPTSLAQGEA